MIRQLFFVKNMPHEAAGLFSSFAEREKIPFRIVDLHRGEPFPTLKAQDAVIVFGGPDSANDQTPKILQELEAIRRILRDDISYLGICLGLQLLVKAAGGKVLRSPVKETGFRDASGRWFEIEKTHEGIQDPLLAGVVDPAKVFQLHGETVELTPSMQCLAFGRLCKNQIVKAGRRAYGIQGHVELSEKMFEDWLKKDEDLREMDPKALRYDFAKIRQELETSAETIFKNFLHLAGFKK